MGYLVISAYLQAATKQSTYNWAKGSHPCRSPYQPDFRRIQRLPKGLSVTGLPFKVGRVTRCFSISFGCNPFEFDWFDHTADAEIKPFEACLEGDLIFRHI